MDVQHIKDLAAEITTTIQSDVELDDQLRQDLVDLTAEVMSDPTEDHLQVLILALKKVAQMEKYANALEVLIAPQEE